MNKGIHVAAGDIAGIINSDDLYRRNDVITKVVKAFDSTDTRAACGDVRSVDPKNLDKTVRYYSSKNSASHLFRCGFMPVHPTFFTYRKYFEELGYYKTDYKMVADYEPLIHFLYVRRLKSKYLPFDLMRTRTGGTGTVSVKSNILLNKEIVRACKENGIRACLPLLCLEYAVKVFELLLMKE